MSDCMSSMPEGSTTTARSPSSETLPPTPQANPKLKSRIRLAVSMLVCRKSRTTGWFVRTRRTTIWTSS